MSATVLKEDTFIVRSPFVRYTENEILAEYSYSTTKVEGNIVTPVTERFLFRTDTKVPKTGLMLIGWGGNNGTTVTAGILANKNNITWNTKNGEMKPNYYGSLTQASTVRLGLDADGNNVYIPFRSMLPMVDPNDLVVGGWDINSTNLADAMERAAVLDYDLQNKLKPHMASMKPLPSIYTPEFIAANQADRADNILKGTKQELVDKIRADIREFKSSNGLDKVIVLWTANTERFAENVKDVNDTADNLLAAIARNEPGEISPSALFAVASILEGSSYINGSPQNTFLPGVVELAKREGVFIGGDDFKSGQTKMKSVLVDFLVSAGIKPTSIVSYNHLGNNDGKNLSSPQQFRSKEVSKSNVVDDMVDSNRILYAEGEKPDHCVVIKYVPCVGDSKRALDEYTSEIFLHGTNTISMHNTCEDSLLATPLIYDLAILCELCERIRVKRIGAEEGGVVAALTASASASASDHTTSNANGATTEKLVGGDKLDTVAGIQNGGAGVGVGAAGGSGGGVVGDAGGGGYERFDVVLSLLSYMLKAPLVPNGTPVVNALFTQRQSLINIFRACVGLAPDNQMGLEYRVPSLMGKYPFGEGNDSESVLVSGRTSPDNGNGSS